MSQCTECRTERDISTEGRLARLEAKLDSIDDKLDGAILSQLKDHGKRLAEHGKRMGELERRGQWLAGWIVGAGAVGAFIARLV